MSSDTFYIQVQAIKGDTIELMCRTSTAGGVNDYAVTRSFALMVLEDGMPYAKTTPLQKRLVELGGGSMPPVWEASFHREHVGEFIASTELVERIGIVGDASAWRDRFELDDATAERDYPLHRFVLRVRVTDPKWLKGLKVGQGWGTTAFDAWWDDPTRPSKAQLAAVERKASRWSPPGAKQAAAKKPVAKKKAAKKVTPKTATKKAPKKATKKATKKTAAKKTAAKKTAAKKTAAKKTAKKTAAKKAPAKKTAAKKTAAKKTAKKTTRATPKKTTKRAAARKTTARKAAKRKPA